MAKALKGDLDGAIADYGKDVLLEPTDFNAFHNRAQLKKKKGDLKGALADLNQAISLGMHDGYVYRELADIKKALGDLDGALPWQNGNLRAILDSVWTARLQVVEETQEIRNGSRLLTEGEIVVESLRYCSQAEG